MRFVKNSRLWEGQFIDKIVQGNCFDLMGEIPSDTIDLIATDPPYGIKFLSQKWDVSVPSVDIWRECLRVLKPGGFAFVMSSPRQDVLLLMMKNLQDAGFITGFTSIYWAYLNGFPKATNISKQLLKCGNGTGFVGMYAGFQPKPAVEVIIVVMKPLSEKTYVAQALKNNRGGTWLDDCRIPYASVSDFEDAKGGDSVPSQIDNVWSYSQGRKQSDKINVAGRFSPNLLVSDNVLDCSKVTKGSGGKKVAGAEIFRGVGGNRCAPIDDEGSYSRYFDLDAWARVHGDLDVLETYPFLFVPKPSKRERNAGLGVEGTGSNAYNRKCIGCGKWERKQGLSDAYTCYCQKPEWEKPAGNNHPTVKPIKLFSYLLTLGSRKGDIVLDPFVGSGTSCLAARQYERRFIGMDCDDNSVFIARHRLAAVEGATKEERELAGHLVDFTDMI